VTKSGKLYSFGNNSKGQLGRGKDCIHPWQPKYVEGDLQGEKVTKVVTSGSSVLALSGILKQSIITF
jgi:regulator of chromosome condensation (RCC1) repeat-containing protein